MSRTITKRRKTSKQNNVFDLTEALVRNGKATDDGPQKKRWTIHDLRHIKPLTPTQQELFYDFFEGKHICGHGSAGTGKSFISLYLALNELFKRDSAIQKIIIVRSAVPTREMGFVPGTLEEKTALYEQPYKDMFAELLGRASSYTDMKEAGIVQFTTTSFIRGVTWDNAIVIVDEGQNMTMHEINSVLTRLGESSRMMFLGDLPQTDLRKNNEKTGMDTFIQIAKTMDAFSVIQFNHNDIVRSAFVKAWIIASEGQI